MEPTSNMKDKIYKFCSGLRIGLLGAALLLAGSSLAVNHLVMAKDSPAKVTRVNLSVNDNEIPRDGKFTTSFAPVVKRVAPSVVKVYVTTKSKAMPPGQSPFGDNDFFRHFFGDQFNQGEQPGGRSPKM